MFFLLLAAVSVALGGWALSDALWSWGRASRDGVLQRVASACTTSLALLLVVSWALAIPSALTQTSLLIACVATGVGGVGWFFRTRGVRAVRVLFLSEHEYSREHLLLLLVFGPVLLWVAFILYRGWLYAPSSHDALAYHLPRAALIVRHHGYAFFDATTMTISAYPANYELLSADVILLSGDDRATEWVGTASYVYLLVVAGALAERWWDGGAIPSASVILLTAVVPSALLHSGAHKNDLLMSGAILATALWAARWSVRGGMSAFLLAWTSLSIAVGIKISAAFLIVGLVPLLAWRLAVVRRERIAIDPKRVAVAISFATALTLLLGAATYLWNLRVLGSFFPTRAEYGFGEGYDDWANLYRFPYLLFSRPFSGTDWGVWVPWRNELWFWPNNDHYFSNLGPSTSILFLVAPVLVWRYARKGDRETRLERLGATLVVVVTFALTMPIRLRPLGFFGMFTRYVTYLPPILAAWTAAPLLSELVERSRRGRAAGWVVLAGLSALFVFQANRCATRDTFAPLASVAEVLEHPERDREIAIARVRAGAFVDHVAGSHDVIAFDGVVNAWIYPVYGRNLTRTVIPLHVNLGMPVEIPSEARWVVIDRNWSMVWNHAALTDMGQAAHFLFQGTAKPIDHQLFDQLKKDTRFRLVFRVAPLQQAVFERVREDGTP